MPSTTCWQRWRHSFLSRSAEVIDGAILSSLERLAHFLGIESATLGEFEEHGEVVVRRSWSAPGFTRIPDGAALGALLPHGGPGPHNEGADHFSSFPSEEHDARAIEPAQLLGCPGSPLICQSHSTHASPQCGRA